jgi:hypothetical protein
VASKPQPIVADGRETQTWYVEEVPGDLGARVRALALIQGRTVRDVLVDAARQYLQSSGLLPQE